MKTGITVLENRNNNTESQNH